MLHIWVLDSETPDDRVIALWQGVRREGNLVPSSAKIKAFSSETKRIPEPKQTKTQAKSQVTRATIGRIHPAPPPIKGRRQKRNENKIKTKGFSKQGIWNRKSWNVKRIQKMIEFTSAFFCGSTSEYYCWTGAISKLYLIRIIVIRKLI